MEYNPDSGYYQGVLQLRNCNKEILTYVKKEIVRFPRVNLMKQKKVKNGIDLYLTNWRFLVSLGKKLQKRFVGTVKTSRKLHTQDRQTDKRIYRVTVMFRMANFKVGDIVKHRGKEIKIRSIGKKVNALVIKDGKRISFELSEA